MLKKTLLFSVFAVMIVACGGGNVPAPSSAEHAEAIRAFYVGLAALDAGDDRRAREELLKATSLASGEPAAWNNLGVLQLRQRDLENARVSFERARAIAPSDAKIRLNAAFLALQQGDNRAAASELGRVIELAPTELIARYLLADLRERETNDAAALELYRQIAIALPINPAVKLEVARLEAKLGQTDAFRRTIEGLNFSNEQLPDESREPWSDLSAAADAGDTRAGATQVSFVRNVLLREPWFRDAISEFKPDETTIGSLIYRPIKLAAPAFRPAAPDADLSFKAETLGDAPVRFAKAIFLDGDSAAAVTTSTDGGVVVGISNIGHVAGRPEHIATFDFDFDFRNDIVIASDKGFKLFRQVDRGQFTDVTSATNLNSEVISTAYSGVWPLDVEHDGDLDLLLARKEGPPLVIQNNSDGSFTALTPFEDIVAVIDFGYADIDEDGDADAIFLTNEGKLRVFSNERGGIFKERELPASGRIDAFAIGDVSGDGRLDIVTLGETINRLTDKGDESGWESVTLSSRPPDVVCECRLFTGDLDNNGANEIVVSGTARSVILSLTVGEAFESLGTQIDALVYSVADINADGKLDLIGSMPDRRAVQLINQSQKGYGWQVFGPRAGKTEGDQRVNSFGIGGEMEIRAGTQTQKQLITSPRVHFGLGEQKVTDVLRVIWGNGFVQAEFDLASDQVIAADQRLKGSCPHLFTWNGESFVLVKDAPPWSPALGLKINAQDTYGILQTEEWFKIPGEVMQPKDGSYELRITGEYWETFYLDNYRLVAVDHPDDTEVFTDERFAIPLPPLKVFTTSPRSSFASVVDHNGNDVAGLVAELDEQYLDGIKRGRFQGVAEDHFVQFELPADAPADRPLKLIADGWVHPTDASINVQLGQSSLDPPRSLSLETEDSNGIWKPTASDLGFPAGKMKTVLIDLPAGARSFRLRTNMEVYWDRLAWSYDVPDALNKTHTLELASAELRYRGFSVIEKANASSPEKPVYDQILSTGQRWRDLEGYYTRFGDVRELLAGVDDRYILMNAGDELVLKFPALPPPASGMKRDFVIIGNGWIKDGDLNSVFSKTVLPLPTRVTNDYTRTPTRLEDDPVFQKHRSDWERFHTRYVTPQRFRKSLRTSD